MSEWVSPVGLSEPQSKSFCLKPAPISGAQNVHKTIPYEMMTAKVFDSVTLNLVWTQLYYGPPDLTDCTIWLQTPGSH